MTAADLRSLATRLDRLLATPEIALQMTSTEAIAVGRTIGLVIRLHHDALARIVADLEH